MNSPPVDHHFLPLKKINLDIIKLTRIGLVWRTAQSPPVDHLLLLTGKSPFSILAHLDNRLAMMLMTMTMVLVVMVMVLVLVMVIVRVLVAQKRK